MPPKRRQAQKTKKVYSRVSQSYYDLLGITFKKELTKSEINNKYFAKLKEWRDKYNKEMKEAKQKQTEKYEKKKDKIKNKLKKARDTLLDPKKKKAYDKRFKSDQTKSGKKICENVPKGYPVSLANHYYTPTDNPKNPRQEGYCPIFDYAPGKLPENQMTRTVNGKTFIVTKKDVVRKFKGQEQVFSNYSWKPLSKKERKKKSPKAKKTSRKPKKYSSTTNPVIYYEARLAKTKGGKKPGIKPLNYKDFIKINKKRINDTPEKTMTAFEERLRELGDDMIPSIQYMIDQKYPKSSPTISSIKIYKGDASANNFAFPIIQVSFEGEVSKSRIKTMSKMRMNFEDIIIIFEGNSITGSNKNIFLILRPSTSGPGSRSAMSRSRSKKSQKRSYGGASYFGKY